VKQITKAARDALLRRPVVVLVAAAGLAVTGCTNNAPTPPSPTPSPPEVTSPEVTSVPPTEPQPATLDWARSMCQALDPAFGGVGVPPQPDPGNLAATRQAYIDYLGNARNGAQQAIDQLSSVGAPPVDNGPQILDNMRNHLIQLRGDLDDALIQLNRADPNDVGATGLALGAVGDILSALGNRAQVLGDLAVNPQLRAAVNQTPECQDLTGTIATTGANQPTGSPQPTS